MIGQTLSHYRISEQLGAGGMGVVYLAHDERLERNVAVKVLLPGTLSDEAVRQRFRREALTLSKLNHPNVAIIFDFDTADGTDFLVTEYVSGTTLDAKLAHGPLPSAEVIRLGIQLAEGLGAAHAQNIVHRDLKPANLRLNADGRLKILDFGLAQLVHPDADLAHTVDLSTSTQQVTGTLPYMSPEQLRGERVDARSDIWAAGAVLYELATGKRPFAGNNGALLIDAILNRNPEAPSKHNPDINPSLEIIILRTLEKDPEKRYQSSRELGADLERLTAGIPLAAGYRRKRWWLAGVISALVLALATGWFVSRHHKQPAAPTEINVRHSVAVLGFKNLSARPDTAWVSTALSEMLTTELAAGENLLTISGENVARVKTDLSLPEQDTLAPDTLIRVRNNLGSDYVVMGSYLGLGSNPDDSVRVDLRLQDAQAGKTIAVVSEKGTLAELDGLITRAGAQLRDRLGAGTVPPDEQLAVKASLPSSLRAARLYAEGLARLRNFDALAARDLLLKAVAEDPKHLPSWRALSATWSTLGYDPQALDAAKRAFDLSVGHPRTERLLAQGQYFEQSSQWEKAITAYKALFDHAPDDVDYGLKLASAQLASGKAQDALGTIVRLRSLPAPQKDDVRIDLSESRVANSVADFKRELWLAESAAAKGRNQGARMLVARALLEQCTARRHLGDPNAAVATCRQAQQLATEAGDRFAMAMAMNNAANVLYDQGDTAGARTMYEDAMRVYKEIGNMHGYAGALDNIASIMGDQGDHAGARTLSEQSLAIYRETGFMTGVAETLNNIGAELITLGKLAEAQIRFTETLKIWHEMGNDSGVAIVSTNLGELRLQLADVPGSKAAYEQALAAFQKGGEKANVAYPQVGLGDVMLASGDLAGAKSHYEAALTISRQANDKHESAFALVGLGEVAFETGDLQTARKNFDEALTIRNELGEKDAVASTQVQLASLTLEEGKPTDAEMTARKAVPASSSEDTGGDAALAHMVLAEALLGQKKIREAQHESATATKLAAGTQLRQVKWRARVLQARTEAAAGSPTTALSSLQEIENQTRKLGLVRISLCARLALLQAERKAPGKTAIGEALERDAREMGFVRIADKAQKAMH